jgi:hypothetical protein
MFIVGTSVAFQVLFHRLKMISWIALSSLRTTGQLSLLLQYYNGTTERETRGANPPLKY